LPYIGQVVNGYCLIWLVELFILEMGLSKIIYRSSYCFV